MSGNDVQRHVRRTVGIAALRRLRRLVDGDAAGQADAARWARRLSVLFALAAIVFVIHLARIVAGH